MAQILLGDATYYARFGFSADLAAALALPGPFERERLLASNLRPVRLDGANGMIVATGVFAPEARGHRAMTTRRAA